MQISCLQLGEADNARTDDAFVFETSPGNQRQTDRPTDKKTNKKPK